MYRRLLAAAALGLVLGGCAAPPREPSVEARPPADFPERAYRQAAAAGQAVQVHDALAVRFTLRARRVQ